MVLFGNTQRIWSRTHVRYYGGEDIYRCGLGGGVSMGLFAYREQAKNGDQAKASDTQRNGNFDKEKARYCLRLFLHRLKILTAPEMPAIWRAITLPLYTAADVPPPLAGVGTVAPRVWTSPISTTRRAL